MDDLEPDEYSSEEFLTLSHSERIGREAFAKEGRAAKFDNSLFRPPRDSAELSVDRLDLADRTVLARIARANAAERTSVDGHPVFFRGWAVLRVAKVIAEGRTVRASPIPNRNPYHADILIPLPSGGEARVDAIRQHAIALKKIAQFDLCDD